MTNTSTSPPSIRWRSRITPSGTAITTSPVFDGHCGPRPREKDALTGLLCLSGMKAERGALGIYRVRRPVPAGNLHRPVEDLAAVGFDALDRRRDVSDAEVDLPVWRQMRHLGRRVHHAPDHSVRTVEHLVLAHRAHVERFAGLPAEDLT